MRLRLDNLLIKQSIFGYLEPCVNHTNGAPSPACGDLVTTGNGRDGRRLLAGFGRGWQAGPIAGIRRHFLLRKVVYGRVGDVRARAVGVMVLRLAMRGFQGGQGVRQASVMFQS